MMLTLIRPYKKVCHGTNFCWGPAKQFIIYCLNIQKKYYDNKKKQTSHGDIATLLDYLYKC